MLSKSELKGGDNLRFGDIVTCVATMAVIFALIAFPLEMVLFSAFGISDMTNWGYIVSLIVSLLLSTLINGYIFAGKIWEARREAITKIAVLWAALNTLIGLIVPASLAHWGLSVEEAYEGQYGTTLSTAEWVSWEMMVQDMVVFLVVVEALVLGFIGLYFGSMLSKPKKELRTAKTSSCHCS